MIAGKESRLTRWRRKLKPINILARIVNDNPHGDGFGVPNDWKHITAKEANFNPTLEYSLRFSNDAFDLVLGMAERDETTGYIVHSSNVHIFRAVIFRRFALWYLWHWATGEWFGLRRKLFYWWLDLHLADWQGRNWKQ